MWALQVEIDLQLCWPAEIVERGWQTLLWYRGGHRVYILINNVVYVMSCCFFKLKLGSEFQFVQALRGGFSPIASGIRVEQRYTMDKYRTDGVG